MFHIDFENAFLQSDVEEELYVALPEGGEQFDYEGSPLVMKLRKTLYGLKQAPRNWNEKLVLWLKQQGFKQSEHDTSVFLYDSGGIQCVLCTYVDDVPLGCNNTTFVHQLVENMRKQFAVGEVEPLKWLLQMEVTQPEAGCICVSQSKYVNDLLAT